MKLNIKFVDPLDGTIYEYSSTEELANAIGIAAGDITVSELEKRGFSVGSANSVYWITPQLPIQKETSVMPELEGIEFIKSSLSNDIEGLHKSADEEQLASETYMERASETLDPDLEKLYKHVTEEEQEHKEEFMGAAASIANGEPVKIKSAKKDCVDLTLSALLAKVAEDRQSFKEMLSTLNAQCDCKFANPDTIFEKTTLEDLMLEMALLNLDD